MMISAASGFINQAEKYSRDNAGQSLKKYTLLKKGELAYNHGASKLRQFGCCFELKEDEARIPYVYHTFSIKESEFAPYIALLLNNPIMDRQLKRLVSSSVRMDGLLNISYDEYMSIKLSVPAIKAEQEKLYSFIEKLDQRIEKQRQLVKALKSYKRGVIQSVFSGSAYGVESAEKWTEKSIAEIFDCIIDKGHPEADVLTIIQGFGTTRRDTGNRRISYDKSSVAAYKRVVLNDFILHLRSFEGGLEIANETGIVSPAYTILRSRYSISPQFYYAYFRSYAFINGKLRVAVEGIRDGKSINMDTFWKIAIPFPSLEEQERFAKLFVGLDTAINQANIMLDKLDTLKRGLLSLLFI